MPKLSVADDVTIRYREVIYVNTLQDYHVEYRMAG